MARTLDFVTKKIVCPWCGCEQEAEFCAVDHTLSLCKGFHKCINCDEIIIDDDLEIY